MVISTVTVQGQKVAQKQFDGMADCLIAPFDLPGAVAKAINTVRPDIYICLETELWPNLLTGLQANKTKLFLLNGRLSERSCRRYRRMKKIAGNILAKFEKIAAITDIDAARFIELGADPDKVTVTGNCKYDLSESDKSGATRTKWRQKLNIAEEQPVLIAGSTHTGEEESILFAYRNLVGSIKELVLVIAPRHLSRLPQIKAIFTEAQTKYDLLSSIKSTGRRHDIVIVDTMGELSDIYAAADYIFCGGSLVARGGHNVFEAAIWGVPVFYGPNMKDFTDARQLLEGNGGIMIRNHLELAEEIKNLATNPRLYGKLAKAALLTARTQQGAADQQLAPVFDAIRGMSPENTVNN